MGKGQHLGFRRIEIGGSWVTKLTQDKTRQYSALGSEADFPEYKDALQAALKWFGEATSEDRPTAGYTVKHAIDDYIRDLRQRKGADAATRNEQAARKHITPSLGVCRLLKKEVAMSLHGIHQQRYQDLESFTAQPIGGFPEND